MKPLVKLDQTITQRPADAQPGMNLVFVDVGVVNIGKVRVSLALRWLLGGRANRA
jgi:hypothetical protein